MQQTNKEEEYEIITDPVIFDNKKFLVLEIDSSVFLFNQRITLLIYPFLVLFGYKFSMALYSLAFFRSALWGFFLYHSLKFQTGIKSNQDHVIKQISILEDGKTCEISTLKKTFNADINKIRKINMQEAMFMSRKIEALKLNFIPIVIETKLYLIPISSKISRKDILGYICEGKYLKFEEVIKNDNTIQL